MVHSSETDKRISAITQHSQPDLIISDRPKSAITQPKVKDLMPRATANVGGLGEWTEPRPTGRRAVILGIIVAGLLGAGMIADAVSPRFNVVFHPRTPARPGEVSGEGNEGSDPAAGSGGSGAGGPEPTRTPTVQPTSTELPTQAETATPEATNQWC